MAVKIRLQRKGRKKAPFYHIVAADARAPRDGRFIERVGFYKPQARGAEEAVRLTQDRLTYWLGVGAQPSDTVARLLKNAK